MKKIPSGHNKYKEYTALQESGGMRDYNKEELDLISDNEKAIIKKHGFKTNDYMSTTRPFTEEEIIEMDLERQKDIFKYGMRKVINKDVLKGMREYMEVVNSQKEATVVRNIL